MRISGLQYEGPIYRPPSEANSLLVQATIGCPHNKCTFCMVYKNGPNFRIRSVEEIKKDLLWAKKNLGNFVSTVFFPSGNTVIMKTKDLVEIFSYTKQLFPKIERITVYGSAQYIVKKTLEDWKIIANAGLSRVHVGLESGDDEILKMVKKGSTSDIQISAGRLLMDAGIQLSEYIILGLGGKERSKQHVRGTVKILNKINPDYIRIRTFLPKVNTPILEDIKSGKFKILSPHEIIKETQYIIKNLKVTSQVFSDHYTNYIQVNGKLSDERASMLKKIEQSLKLDEHCFRDVYIGNE